MSNELAIKVENLSKRYRLGLIHYERLSDADTVGLKWTASSFRRFIGLERRLSRVPNSKLHVNGYLYSLLSTLPKTGSSTFHYPMYVVLAKENFDAFKYLRLENFDIPLKSIDTLADITAGYAGAFYVSIIKKIKSVKA